MKKTLLLIAAFSIIISPAFATTIIPEKGPKADQFMIPLPGTNQEISLAAFVKLSTKEYKSLTGKKLKLKDKISFKVTQWQLKKAIKKDGTVNVEKFKKWIDQGFEFHWGGFFLGLFLGLIGFIITLFFRDENKKSRMISSLIGWGIWVALFFLTIA